MTASTGDGLIERARYIAPKWKEGRSNGFAFRMDGLGLWDLNKLVNDLADTIQTLQTERDAALSEPALIVAWLRGQALEAGKTALNLTASFEAGLRSEYRDRQRIYEQAAKRIENGEHLPLRGAAIRALNSNPAGDAQ